MQPEPVPTSTIRSSRDAWRLQFQFENRLDHVLGFWPRDQHSRVDDQIHAPEFLMASDVLGRDASRALGQRRLVAGFLFRREFSFGMREEVCAIAVEREH